MQIESVFQIPSISAQLFIILSIVSITIGICLTVFGFIRQKRYKKSMLATICIVFGPLVIVCHSIQIIIRML
ncbi:hypothetical protein CSE16_13455 [Solibacillus sp. R5-41]|nr:hypothetical protein CSE16_13455 [Solibacillus sp. R5-41]